MQQFYLNIVTSQKSKDGIYTREDLVQLSIRPDLHAKYVGLYKNEMTASRFTMSKEGMQQFCMVFILVKVPYGYLSNISSNIQVKDRKILNLKTYDCHVLLYHLIQLVLCGNIDGVVAKGAN